MATYKGILTNNGKALIAAATVSNKINYSHLAVGDGNGSVPIPLETRTALVNEKARIALNVVEINQNNTNQIICEAILPSNVGGFFIREIGLYAGTTLVVNASYPPTYKPLIDEGGACEIAVKLIVNIQNAEVVALYLDDSLIYATRNWVNTNYIRRNEIIDNLTTDDATKPVSAKQAKALQDSKLALTGGSLTGALNLANRTWNLVGNDVLIGDYDVAGALCLKPNSSETPGIAFFDKNDQLINILTPNQYAGNSASATKLANSRKIGGIDFNGTTDINLPGVNADGNQNTTGNAASASKLQTSRKINNVNFNGTEDITIKDDTKLALTGGSLTGALNLANRTWNLVGNDVLIGDYDVAGALCLKPNSSETPGIAFFDKNDQLINILTPNQYAGNSASATKLANSRKIGGIDFNGTTDINLPGVNADGNQNTTGNAASASKLQTSRKINNVNFNGTEDITIKDDTKLALTGGSLTGALNLANRTWNLVGNDVLIGDYDVAGALCLKPNSSETPGIAFFDKNDQLINILTPNQYAGNSASASKLQTSRKINNVNFNGTEDITIKDDTKLALTGGSLTGALNLANRTWNLVGNDVLIGDYDVAGALCLKPNSSETPGIAFFDKNDQLINILTPNQYAGNSASATKLANSRKIGGIDFNGTTDINLPGVNADGNQNTTGNAATASKLQTARKINFLGSVAGELQFDGSTDIYCQLTMQGFLSQKSNNGYMTIPQSDNTLLILQWGTYLGGGTYSSPRVHTFPIEFPSQCFSVVATTEALASNRFTSVGNLSNKSFKSINSGSADDAFRWIAIGA